MKKLFTLFFASIIIVIANNVNAQMPEFTRFDTCRISEDLGNSQGSALADIDNDGDIDLTIGNSGMFPGTAYLLVYKNERKGNFTKMKTGDLAAYPQPTGLPAASLGDFDNDGDWDVWMSCNIYINNGFGEYTMEYLDSRPEGGCGHHVTTWVDVDQDGYLDFYLLKQNQQASSLYLGNGDGTFSQVEDDVVSTDLACRETVSWADIDNDGDMDLFSANFSFLGMEPGMNCNTCYINEGGTFTRMDESNILVQHDQGTLGGSWGDYDNDGDLDLYLATARDYNYLYQNDGSGNFTQLTIDPPEAEDKCFTGSAWGDFDNDGDLDLFVTSETNEIDFVDEVYVAHYNMLLQNNGDGSFTDVAAGHIKDDGGHSCTLLDYDNDGDLDILIPNGSIGEPLVNYLYTNEGNDNNWININCRGTLSNASAIGARVYVKANIYGDDIWQMRELAQETGLHSFSSPRFHFGLGDAEVIDSMIIRWPSGGTDTYLDIQANQFLSAVEGTSLQLDYSASNYIEYGPSIESLEIESGEDLSIDLDDYFRLVTGDSVPEGAGEVLSYTLFDDQDPDMLTSGLDGSLLTLHGESTTGNTAVKLQASADMFVTRIDEIAVEITESTSHISNSITGDLISIYPNPAGDWLTVKFMDEISASIGIYDLSGKLCILEMIEGGSAGVHTLSLAGLESGIYLIRISGKSFIYEEKLIRME